MEQAQAQENIEKGLEDLRLGKLDNAEFLLVAADRYLGPLAHREFLRASIYLERGKNEKAIRALKTEIISYPEDQGSIQMLANLIGPENVPKRQSLDPQLLDSVRAELQGHIERSDWNPALDLSVQLLAIEPKAIGFNYLRGLCLGKLGLYYQALTAYQMELDLNPDCKDSSSAIEAINNALATKPPLQIPPRNKAWK